MARCLVIAYSNYVRDARLKRHVASLARLGGKVDLICLAEATHSARVPEGVNLVSTGLRRYRGHSRLSYVASYLHFFAKATVLSLRLSMARPYDLVLVSSMPDLAVLCATPLRLFASRVVLDLKDTMPELYREKFSASQNSVGERLLRWQERISAGLADLVFAVHEPHRRRLEANGIPVHKIRIIMNLPDPSIFHPRPIRRPPRSGFEIVCHGTIAKRLGLDTAFDALSFLQHKIAGIKFTVIGSGDYLPTAKARASASGVAEQVDFVAPLPLEELPERLARADLGLIPNPAGPATDLMLPVKMLEYAAMGIPVIASALATIRYYFPDDAAYLVKPGDARAMADAIEELFRNAELRAKLARRALEVVKSLRQKEKAQDVYREVLELAMQRGGKSLGRAESLGPAVFKEKTDGRFAAQDTSA